eukprot:2796066-Amphidinium_carterae.1
MQYKMQALLVLAWIPHSETGKTTTTQGECSRVTLREAFLDHIEVDHHEVRANEYASERQPMEFCRKVRLSPCASALWIKQIEWFGL